MADPNDPNPALRAGLVRLLAASTTQSADAAMPTILQTPALQARFEEAFERRERRRFLLQALVDALNAVIAAHKRLNADGYPTLDPLPLVPDLLAELQAERASLEAAIAQFQAATPETGDFNPRTSIRS